MRTWQIEWGKLGLIMLLILGGFGLVFVAILDHSLSDDRFAITLALGSSIITGAMGYLFGNGRLASRGEISVPTIAPMPPPPRDAGSVDVGVIVAWFIVGALLAAGVASLAALGGAVLCSWP